MFECNRIEKRSPNGQLDHIGVAWTETVESFENFLFAMAIVLMVVGLMLGFVAVVLITAKAWTAALVVGALAAVLSAAPVWSVRIRSRSKPRRLLFHADGRITAPLGFASYAKWAKNIPWALDDVMSIEARQSMREAEARASIHTHGVVGYSRQGHTAYIGKFLTPDQAHQVAVQLTLALKTLRDELANGHVQKPRSTGRNNARPRAAGQAAAMID